jgi:hypothetical protein
LVLQLLEFSRLAPVCSISMQSVLERIVGREELKGRHDALYRRVLEKLSATDLSEKN